MQRMFSLVICRRTLWKPFLLRQLWFLVMILPGLPLIFVAERAAAQNLHFTVPSNFLAGATTDKAIDMTNFKGGFFVTWKEAGNDGYVHLSYLGRHYDTAYSHRADILQGEQTVFAPVFRVCRDRIYLFWIGKDGSLKYVINNSDTSFSISDIHRLSFTGGVQPGYGITAAVVNDKILIAAHAMDKSHLVYALAEPGKDGLLPETRLMIIPGITSADYPFVVGLNDRMARFCWRGYKDQKIYCTDYTIPDNIWGPPVVMGQARSKVAPAIYQIGDGARLFYIWKGPDKEKRMYYATATGNIIPAQQTALPVYFATDNPVSVCKVDRTKFILAYTGIDKKLYLSYFSNYNPATWMKDLLMPLKGGYTLSDIVIPGAHDAGMSVLTAVGGTQSGTINDCNTLTQRLNIGAQLNAGIRMFDLRVGIFNGQLYIKHCSSDCMEDAIGGGYGERLGDILTAIRQFLESCKGEIVLLTFSHFCEREIGVKQLADTILSRLGSDIVFRSNGKEIHLVSLRELAGKVLLSFEHYAREDGAIDSSTISDGSRAFINFRRAYAATNEVDKLLMRQESFFRSLDGGRNRNDLVRLDWQLTQSSDEAAMTCNDFQNDQTNPLIDGAMLLTNVIRRHQSIIDLSISGNKYLPVKLNEWIGQGMVNRKNKPNIIYVDVAGAWVTDYCIYLNSMEMYRK